MVNLQINKFPLHNIKNVYFKNFFLKKFLKFKKLKKKLKLSKRNKSIINAFKVCKSYFFFKARQAKAKQQTKKTKKKIWILFNPYKFLDKEYATRRFFYFITFFSVYKFKCFYQNNNLDNLYFLFSFIKHNKKIKIMKHSFFLKKKKIFIFSNKKYLNKLYKKFSYTNYKYFTALKKKKKNKRLKIRFFFFNNFFFFFIVKFINIVMKCGKKDKSILMFKKIIFNLLIFYPKQNPFNIILLVFFNLRVVLALKKKKVAGRVHHVPFFLNNIKQVLVGLKIFISVAREALGNGFVKKLVNEFVLIYNKDIESSFMKKKKDIYNLALENKYYVKFL